MMSSGMGCGMEESMGMGFGGRRTGTMQMNFDCAPGVTVIAKIEPTANPIAAQRLFQLAAGGAQRPLGGIMRPQLSGPAAPRAYADCQAPQEAPGTNLQKTKLLQQGVRYVGLSL